MLFFRNRSHECGQCEQAAHYTLIIAKQSRCAPLAVALLSRLRETVQKVESGKQTDSYIESCAGEAEVSTAAKHAGWWFGKTVGIWQENASYGAPTEQSGSMAIAGVERNVEMNRTGRRQLPKV